MTRAILNLKGKKFGRLRVIEASEKRQNKKVLWCCECECGNKKLILGVHLKSGHTKSCGCLQADITGRNSRAHGLRDTRTYNIWASVKQRCSNPNNGTYHKYGGRGIKCCKRWWIFENFLKDMGQCPDGYSIERIDVNGDYEPNNCKWIPLNKQARNRRSNRNITYKGQTRTIIEWSEYTGIKYSTLYGRLIHYGWPIKDALEVPVISGQKLKRKGKGHANKITSEGPR